MAVGQKTGGREKGTPNKRTQNLLSLIDSRYSDFSPILELIKIYKSKEASLELKTTILKDISPYMYPKIRPITNEMLFKKDYDKEISDKTLEQAFEKIFKCIDLLIAQNKFSNLSELNSYLKSLVREFKEDVSDE